MRRFNERFSNRAARTEFVERIVAHPPDQTKTNWNWEGWLDGRLQPVEA